MSLAETNSDRKDTLPLKERLNVSDIPILFLVGGMGTRVRKLTNDEIPKPLIKISGGQTIIDLICDNLGQLGYSNFIFCLGLHSEKVKTHLLERNWHGYSPRLSFSEEESEALLGPAGASYRAILSLKLSGPVFLLPGDMFLPWSNFREMVSTHIRNQADATFGVTSVVTERTSDIGKIIAKRLSGRLIGCYARDESFPMFNNSDIETLTSAGVVLVDGVNYLKMYENYFRETKTQPNYPLSIRDDLVPWALANSDYKIYGFDLRGEALDLGTEDMVLYAKSNWRSYMLVDQKNYE